MARRRLVLFKERNGIAPLLNWLEALPAKARAKCRVRLERLSDLGHDLRRPEADYLRNGVYELRAKHSGMNYRILYFFHGTEAVVVSHGFSKQRATVSPKQIQIALRRKREFEASPERHTYEEKT